jgi:hypothetical protein
VDVGQPVGHQLIQHRVDGLGQDAEAPEDERSAVDEHLGQLIAPQLGEPAGEVAGAGGLAGDLAWRPGHRFPQFRVCELFGAISSGL